MFHASPNTFAFPDYALLTTNQLNHDNGLLGLWVATESDWIESFGTHVYAVEITGNSQDLTLSQLVDWDRKKNDPAFYRSQRQAYLDQGIDFLRLIETDGRSAMGIVLNFDAISAFQPMDAHADMDSVTADEDFQEGEPQHPHSP